MNISKAADRATTPGNTAWFTGDVKVEMLVAPEAPARASVASVTFQPGARTAWHTHPLGQSLIVTMGRGLVQREGGKVEPISAGDVVWFPPGERHWHGAAPDSAMTHIALQEQLDGKTVDWAEQVTEAEYSAR
ncbi:cupin domain-containing protein [Paracoccus contaminans]|uniref:Cupin n=1 Tax=Paracoccus contaminans TaxID=1945662 RepID=A0A1W6D1A4_9RHOB|nr:cupin domain-containing protein [Paracoccus contaminans]ARJ70898.1 cupin [Paracoccus contaminans]